MHWHVRRARGKDGRVGPQHPTSHDAAKAERYQKRVGASGTKSLSNQELRHLVDRMNLEQNYARLQPQKTSRGRAGANFAKQTLLNAGKQTIQQAANEAAKKGLAKALAKAAAKKAAQAAAAAVVT
jgi:predicted phage tail protein